MRQTTSQFSRQRFTRSLAEAELAVFTGNKVGSYALLPFGAAVRSALYKEAISLGESLGYKEVVVPHVLERGAVKLLDNMEPMSSSYLPVGGADLQLAATHEVAVYTLLRSWLRTRGGVLPVRVFCFGPAFRRRKKARFPFGLGERNSFLEFYGAFKSENEADAEFDSSTRFNRILIKDRIGLPGFEVERPLSTNKPFSTRTVCFDTITPLGRTVITGMAYAHSQKFSRLFAARAVGCREFPWCVHFGVSDNLLWSLLVNVWDHSGFRLHSWLSPVQVAVIVVGEMSERSHIVENLLTSMQREGIRSSLVEVSSSELGTVMRRLKAQGVPIVYILFPGDCKRGMVVGYYRASDCRVSIKVEEACQARRMLHENDLRLKAELEARESASVFSCDSLDEVRSVLSIGGVAKVGLRPDDLTVRLIEREIKGGEVLGFAATQECIPDFISREMCAYNAYISKRI